MPAHCLRRIPFVLALSGAAFTSTAVAPAQDAVRPLAALRAGAPCLDRVLHDDRGASAGVRWASGRTWKASFTRDGIGYHPAFAPDAPRNFPLGLRLATVTVGGNELPFAAAVSPQRAGDRLTFDRGVLQEHYDLRPDHVEQTFVLATERPGDVVFTIDVTSELVEDPDAPGLQFGNEHGRVDYSDAVLVLGDRRVPLATTFADGRIRIEVPAALRGAGPLVVDPILGTVVTRAGQQQRAFAFPDVSYDADAQRHLVVWERQWSAIDGDVLAEVFSRHGTSVGGGAMLVEGSSFDARVPRVAGLRRSAVFLVCYEHTDPTQWGQRRMIVGNTVGADGSFLGPMVPISDVAMAGDASTPDVGGDPSLLPNGAGFAVVWTQTDGGTGRIVRRMVDAVGAPSSAAEPLSPGTADTSWSPQISHGNGNGQVADPAWFVVHSTRILGSVDVVGHTIAPSGAIGGRVNLALGADEDWYPFVSSPATDAAGRASWFLVTWERQGLVPTSFAAVYDHRTGTCTAPTDLTPVGIGSFWVRAESDGLRFVLASSRSNHGGSVALSTIAWTGSRFVLHEDQQDLPGVPSFPMLVAERNGGGAPGRYTAVCVDSAQAPAAIALTRYEGRQSGPEFVQHAIGCRGRFLIWTGRPVLGGSLDVAMFGYAADVPLLGIGFPAAVPVAVCAPCQLGLRLDLPLQLVFGATTRFAVPTDTGLVGTTFAVQGLSVGAGTCFSGLATSDLVEVTIR
jgi:hypothetical protein